MTGATLTVLASGTTAASETYTLPAALWTAVAGGFKYQDPQLTQGPVRTASIRVANGAFQLQAKVSGRTGGIGLVPPTVGSEGCLLLDIPGADPRTGMSRSRAVFSSALRAGTSRQRRLPVERGSETHTPQRRYPAGRIRSAAASSPNL